MDTRSTRFSFCTCHICGRSIIGLPIESQRFGVLPATCRECHARTLAETEKREQKAVTR